MWHGFCVLGTFHLVCYGWLLFRADSLAQVADLSAIVLAPWQWGAASLWWLPLCVLAAPLLAMQLAERWTGEHQPVLRLPWPARSAVYLVLFCGLVLLGEDGGRPFVYFQF